MQNSTRLTLETVEGTEMRFRAEAPSGHALVLESGKGRRAADPVEALLASLGACHGMDVIHILRKKRQDVTGYEIQVEAERRDEHPRALTRVVIVHRVRGRDVRPAAVEEAIRLSAETYCSVHASLADAVEITNRFEILPA